MRGCSILFALSIVGCGNDDGKKQKKTEEVGLSVLGSGTNDINEVKMTEIGDENDGLKIPRDLAFNPDVEGELWVVNQTNDSMTIFTDAGTDNQTSENIIDPYALHFMDQPSSLAFGAALFEETTSLNFGTCQESVNDYNGGYQPNYFMGPTLWTSDRDLFGESNPDAVAYLTEMFGMYVDLGSHIDMLHESPLCMGIAHDYDNVYWVFDGYNESIYRYDFQEDHGMGYDDHSDGIMERYVEGEIAYAEDIPSHLILDEESRLLYIADTGNNRIAVLDTETGTQGDNIRKAEPGTVHHEMLDADLWTLVDGSEFGMEAPSGIELIDGTLFVTDNATSEIIAFSLDGEEIDRLNTELDSGSLMGVFAASIDDLWIVDALENRVFRIQSK